MTIDEMEIEAQSYNPRIEEYFKKTGEKAHCLSVLHGRAERVYSFRRQFSDIPVIVFSGCLAFLNASSSTLFKDPQLSSIILGAGSFGVGMISTISSYYGWSKRAEGHRIASIQYAKLFRFLSIELALEPESRISVRDLLKMVQNKYDNLSEVSPPLPKELIVEFKKDFDKPEYKNISRPAEANGLEEIIIYNPLIKSEGRPEKVSGARTPNDSVNTTSAIDKITIPTSAKSPHRLFISTPE